MVVAARCTFVSESKTKVCRASKRSCCVAVVSVAGRGGRSALPPGKREERVVDCRCRDGIHF